MLMINIRVNGYHRNCNTGITKIRKIMRNSQNKTNENNRFSWFTWRHLLCIFFGIIIGFCFSAVSPNLKKYRKEVCSNVCNDYQGIDVSNHQGRIDWALVSTDKNIQFVYIKATEGATHVDQSYSYNILESRKNGLKAGSYHYLRRTSNILSQFKNFTSIAKVDEQDLIPMVDVEEKIDKDSIKLFCDLIERHYGKKPVIYGQARRTPRWLAAG